MVTAWQGAGSVRPTEQSVTCLPITLSADRWRGYDLQESATEERRRKWGGGGVAVLKNLEERHRGRRVR